MFEKKMAYIWQFIKPDHPQMRVLDEQNLTRRDIQPNVGPDVAKLLGLLIRLTGAQRVLEFGTCLGYSAICMGEALRETGGKLITIESYERLYKEAVVNIEKAGLSDVVEIIYGDASEIIYDLEGPFDLILQDSSKSLYPTMYERSLQLLRKNGLLMADDTLFKPMGIRDSLSGPVDEYNRMAFADARLYTTLLPIGDGLTISVKIRD